ncbi:inner membrane transporter RhtA [Kribbella amoyensis]|uniref:Inner membrane transporter RhtA n=1 Tax=Kribbella amoyensis TaxID=996641 RepID=A0A561BRW5_9ACTN|nr:EamA family transporter [Kribbella amoyensis]TWD81637.1 inner membrane transporter RhtA [Kribbella amoyensis]
MSASTVGPAGEVEVVEVVVPAAERTGRFRAVGLMLASASSNQFGAAVGALGFPALGPAGVVAIRQWVAAVVMMTAVRPPLRSFTRREWIPVLGLAAIYATMNLTLYTAVDRIGLGLAVTLEFLGPLTVALAALRRRVDLFCAVFAGAAVMVLMRPQPTTDYLGIAMGLVAACCWAGYILLNRTLGRRLPSAQGAAASAAVSALAYLPVGVWILVHHTPGAQYLAYAAVAGVLSSAVPYLVDLFALRIVRPGFFGMFMSVHPLLAVVVGWLILDQRVGWVEWVAICAIVAANAISVATAQRGRL